MSSLRSNKLFGQIKRTLRSKKYAEDDFQPTEIYDSLRSAQEQIFARINFERKYSLSLLVNTENYLLSSLVNTDGRIYIKDIKSFIRPASWRYPLEYINSVRWEIEKKRIRHAPQPVIATMFNNSLYLYPAPTAVDTLVVDAILFLPETDIDKNTDPELTTVWDEALKTFTLYDLTGDMVYHNLFEDQIRLIGASTYSFGGDLQKEMV